MHDGLWINWYRPIHGHVGTQIIYLMLFNTVSKLSLYHNHRIFYFIIIGLHRLIISSYFNRLIQSFQLRSTMYDLHFVNYIGLGLYIVSCVGYHGYSFESTILILSFGSTAIWNQGQFYCDWPFSGKYGNEVSGIRYFPVNGLQKPSRKTPSTGTCG